MKKINRVSNLSLAIVVVLISICLLTPLSALAAAKAYYPGVKSYQSRENAEHLTTASFSVSNFAFGAPSIGRVELMGSVNEESTINQYPAYAVDGTLTIGYAYDGSYLDGEKTEWNLYSDSGKTAAGIALKKKIEKGTIIIQKSTDGVIWTDAVAPLVNVFPSSKIDLSNLYTVTSEDLYAGTYFRVIVAYEMRQKTGTNERWGPIPDEDIYDYIYCTEVYEFYACYGLSPLVIRDIISGEEIKTGATVSRGFTVDKNGSTDTVTIQRESEKARTISTITTVSDAGKYLIEVTSPLNQKYYYSVTVSEGLNTVQMKPTVYENAKKHKYSLETPVSGNTSFEIPSHSVLTLGHGSDSEIVQSRVNGFPAYGIKGDSVYLLLKLQHTDIFEAAGWTIVSDTWGKKTSEQVAGVQTGQIGTGALIIQTSTDGVNWENVDKSRYARGLFTTDYESNYGDMGDVLIYTPDGKQVLKGIYIRVLYAYEVEQKSTKSDFRCVEEYAFYLCSDEVDAVTFHNLSVTGQVEEACAEYDDATAEIIRKAETMTSGAYTVSGFRIDNSLNPTVKYFVTRNGNRVAIPTNHEFTETGRYEITLTSAVGTKKVVTIYVDRLSNEEALKLYFGESFINGKRIYSDGELPVFEGGKTSYQLQEVGQSFLPLSGMIVNTMTGDKIEISATAEEKAAVLNIPGHYEAKLSTNTGDAVSGDNRIFTFRFNIIPEGTAPGPVVNQRNLQAYSTTTITDSYPVYYALTYQSAATGYITLAFSSKQAALDFAYNYEKGMVEQQADGTYRYNGSFIFAQKEQYISAWDLTDAIYLFAEQAIRTGYFDISNEFTVLTLEDDVLEETANLRTLELARSVTLFAEGQKAELTKLEALPIISPKPYVYLTPGQAGHVDRGYTDFSFIHDKYGCDSSSVTIIDANGREYEIAYDRGVGNQLALQKCPTGIVTIRESTIYGDTAEYQAVFIAEGDNTATLTLDLYKNGGEEEKRFSQDDNGASFEVDAFSVKALMDEMDPYSMVIVSDGKNETFYVADQIATGIWTDPGKYTIKVVNRLGFSYSININVTESDYATLRFEGDGTESVQDILTTYGEEHVKLPEVERYGYSLIGFSAEDGNMFSDEIAKISFKGTTILTAVWRAKQYTVTLQTQDGQPIDTLVIDYGCECELPTPDLGDSITFTGWTLNGVKLDSNVITLQSEGDITLVASTDVSEISNDSEIESSDFAEENKRMGPAAIIVGITVCVLIGIVLVMKNRRATVVKVADSPDINEDECTEEKVDDE